MTTARPILMWFRRDLRLADHPALTAAIASGQPVIPVFIHDEVVAGQGAAARFRLGLSVAALARDLAAIGSRLTLRRGKALDVLRDLIADAGAGGVYWTRAYDPDAKVRDVAVKAALKAAQFDARSFPGHTLFEPWDVTTKTGGFYKVYTPLWKAVRGRDVAGQLPAPGSIPAPDNWPGSDNLDDWNMGADMRRGGPIVAAHCVVGETAARDRLGAFIDKRIHNYKSKRDFPAAGITSGLSENLTYGEISPHACWFAGWDALHNGVGEAEHFLKELVWREFAYHLVHHTPHITRTNWRDGWERFPWSEDADSPAATAWMRGRTGVPFVDAGMREMYVTGTMHNRTRMIVASYLTKHLMTHWQIGMDWFADCLIDWDPASNAMGWQWTAGSGPDAAPYFRVYNPVTQIDKFDPDHAYLDRWIAEDRPTPSPTALSYFDAVPRKWNLSAKDRYPEPIVALDRGRARALAAYQDRDF